MGQGAKIGNKGAFFFLPPLQKVNILSIQTYFNYFITSRSKVNLGCIGLPISFWTTSVEVEYSYSF